MILILFHRLRDSRSSTLAANLALLVVSVLVLSSNTARSFDPIKFSLESSEGFIEVIGDSLSVGGKLCFQQAGKRCQGQGFVHRLHSFGFGRG